jgi:hypothetical protein
MGYILYFGSCNTYIVGPPLLAQLSRRIAVESCFMARVENLQKNITARVLGLLL